MQKFLTLFITVSLLLATKSQENPLPNTNIGYQASSQSISNLLEQYEDPNHTKNLQKQIQLPASQNLVSEVNQLPKARQLNGCAADEWEIEGGCIASCESPLIASSDGQTCSRPCENSENYYNTELEACQSECELPYFGYDTEYIKLCSYGIDNDQKTRMDILKGFFDGFGYVVAVYIFLSLIIKPSDLTPFLMVIYLQLLASFKYIGDMSLPSKLSYVFSTQNENPITLNFGPGMPDSLREQFQNLIEELDITVFQQMGLHSSFLVNYFETLTTLTILFAIMLLATLIAFIAQRKQKRIVYDISLGIKIAFRWNLMLVLIYSNFGSAIVYFVNEIKTLSAASLTTSSYVSLAFGGVSVLFMVLTFVFLPLFIKKRMRIRKFLLEGQRKKLEKQQKFIEKLERYQFLYLELKEDHNPSQIYFIVLLMRFILHFILIAVLGNVRQAQTALLIVLGIAQVTYVHQIKPFNKQSGHRQAQFFETLVIFYAFFMFIASLLEPETLQESDFTFVVYVMAFAVFYLACFVIIKNKLTPKKQKSNTKKSKAKIDEVDSVEHFGFRWLLIRAIQNLRNNSIYDPSEFSRPSQHKKTTKIVPLNPDQTQINSKNFLDIDKKLEPHSHNLYTSQRSLQTPTTYATSRFSVGGPLKHKGTIDTIKSHGGRGSEISATPLYISSQKQDSSDSKKYGIPLESDEIRDHELGMRGSGGSPKDTSRQTLVNQTVEHYSIQEPRREHVLELPADNNQSRLKPRIPLDKFVVTEEDETEYNKESEKTVVHASGTHTNKNEGILNPSFTASNTKDTPAHQKPRASFLSAAKSPANQGTKSLATGEGGEKARKSTKKMNEEFSKITAGLNLDHDEYLDY